MREALIVWGGWSGHEPEKGAHILSGMLEADDFKVYIENTTEAFADPAIRDGRPHRASGALAYHVLEVMLAFQTSSDAGLATAIRSRPERPEMLAKPRIVGPLD